MSRRFLSIAGAGLLALSAAGAAMAQDTPTTTTTTTVRQSVQNPDGSWSVVEYPVGREVQVNFVPGSTVIPGATGTATILRSPDGTTVKLNMNNVTGDVSNLNLYAVEPNGAVTLLGPLAVNNGTVTYSTTTPLNRFMLVVSPDANISTYSPDLHYAFRSDVPQGLAIVPYARSGQGPGSPEGAKVAAVASSAYSVPMLNVPSLPMKKETEVHVNTDNAAFKRATFFVTPNFNNKGAVRVKAKFHELADVPKDAYLTLWAVGPDGSFMRLGSTRNQGNPNVATIDTDKNNTNVPLSDFGLFMTTEPTETITSPSGPVVIRIIK